MLHQAGRLDEASRCYRQIAATAPADGRVLGFLGMVTAQSGSAISATRILRRAATLVPEEAAIHSNLGNALVSLGLPALASGAYCRAVALAPAFSTAHFNLASVTRPRSRQIAILLRSISCDPGYVPALLDLAQLQTEPMRPGGARSWCRRALAIAPPNTAGLQIMVSILLASNLTDRSKSFARRAMAAGSDPGIPLFLLGRAADKLGDLDLARQLYRQCLAVEPMYGPGHTALASLYLTTGYANRAVDTYGRVSAAVGFDDIADGNRLFALAFVAHDDPQTIVRASRRWGSRASQLMRDRVGHPATSLDRNPIRIGYVSPEFVKHGFLAHFLPVLEHHNRSHFQIFAYSQNHETDNWTAIVRDQTDIWRDVSGLDLAGQAAVIREDGIHILVNLTGYIAHYRRLFAQRSAPLQISYLNHMSPTGLTTIDARISDSWLEPTNAPFLDREERLVRLKTGYVCYKPSNGAPDPGPLPALANGYVTFGVFNNLAKVSARALDCWASILKRLPTAKILIKSYGLSSESARAQILNEFGWRGVAAERIDLVGRVGTDRENLLVIARSDVGLDTFPFNGGMSTVETLWMGCPVVTLAGDSLVGRVGVTFLARAGFPEWIAPGIEEYIDLAVDLASNVPRLAVYRKMMRDRLRRSPLLDAQSHTRELETVYEELLLGHKSTAV